MTDFCSLGNRTLFLIVWVFPVYRHVGRHMGRHVGIHVGRHVSRHMDRCVDRHVGRHVGIYVDRRVDRHMDRHVGRHMVRHVGIHMDRCMDRQVGRRGKTLDSGFTHQVILQSVTCLFKWYCALVSDPILTRQQKQISVEQGEPGHGS